MRRSRKSFFKHDGNKWEGVKMRSVDSENAVAVFETFGCKNNQPLMGKK